MNNMPEPNTLASGQPSKLIKDRQTRLRDRSALQEAAAQPSGPEKTIRKRKFSGRVKRACENCKKGKRCCDENRPCARCVRLGLEKTCRDAKRKNSKEEEPKDSNAGHAHNNCAGNSHEGSSEASLSPCSSPPVHAHSAPSSYHGSVSSGLDLYDPNYDGFAKLLASAKEIDSRNPSKESRPPVTVFPSPSLTTAHHPSHFPSFAKKEKASTTRPLEMPPLVPNNLESIHILLRTIMASEKI